SAWRGLPAQRADISVVDDGLGALLEPQDALLNGAVYQVLVEDGPLNVAGFPLVPFRSSFTTQPLRTRDSSRLHPPLDADVPSFPVFSSIDLDRLTIRTAVLKGQDGQEESVLAADLDLAAPDPFAAGSMFILVMEASRTIG
ncbi:MAG: hypothetical protein ACE5ID_11845, partial [Acidobacteriota bacterium]